VRLVWLSRFGSHSRSPLAHRLLLSLLQWSYMPLCLSATVTQPEELVLVPLAWGKMSKPPPMVLDVDGNGFEAYSEESSQMPSIACNCMHPRTDMVHSQKITMATPSFNGEVAPPSLPTDTGIQIKQKRQAAAAIGARLGQMVPEAETSRSALGTTRPPATTSTSGNYFSSSSTHVLTVFFLFHSTQFRGASVG